MRRSRSVTLTDDQKEAIKNLPEKKKIQLLHRLIRKDPKLVDQIQYEYIENKETQELRREDLEESFTANMDEFLKDRSSITWWLSDIRSMSSQISWHASVTKDVFGEIYLNLIIMNRCLDRLTEVKADYFLSRRMDPRFMYDVYSENKMLDYFARRIKKLVKLMAKVHEDLFLELNDHWRKLTLHLENNESFQREAGFVELNIADLEDFVLDI